MSKNLDIIPASELVERVNEIARLGSQNDDSRIWGALNDVYVRELPIKEDWTFFLASSAILCTPEYTTGTASVNTGATAVTFAGGAALTAAMTGRKIHFTNNANVYTLTFLASSSGTLNVGLSEDQNISSGAFEIYQPLYTLAPNFSRFPKGGGLQLWRGGRPIPCDESPIQTYYDRYVQAPGTPERCRLAGPDTAGVMQVEIIPPPDKAYLLPYDYFFTPAPLRETTGGTATVSAGSSSVTFHAGALVAEAGSGWYFRIDDFGTGSQSEWYRVTAVSAANSTVTLQTAFGLSAATSAGYTLCAAPQLPILLHRALLEGTVAHILADQNDPLTTAVQNSYMTTLSDAKRLYKSRPYNQDIDTILTDANFRR